MNKSEIIKMLKKINLPKEEYWVLAGSALVMHGVKDETRDIDMGCTKNLFEKLILNGYDIKKWDDGCRSINLNDDVEIFEEWNVNEIQYINNFPVGSLESIKEHKLELGREKDLNDIQLIDEFIRREYVK